MTDETRPTETNPEHVPTGGADGPAVHVDVDMQFVARAFPRGSTGVSSFLTALETAHARRREVAAKIIEKLNEERPHNQAALNTAGLGWKSNFTTRPLATLCGRVTGRLVRAVNTSRFLTTTALPPESGPDYRRKSERFQQLVTEFVRTDPRWSELIEGIAQGTALFGYEVVVWLSDTDWMPNIGEQRVMLPAGTKTVAAQAQQIVLKVDHRPDEAFVMLARAMEAQQSAGDQRWNVEKLVTAINRAMPVTQARQQETTAGGDYAMMVAEMRRALMEYGTAMADKVVPMYHIWVREITGRVTYLIYASDKTSELFRHEDAFESMDRLAAFFALERPVGTGMIAASKGVGRAAYAMASVLDRARNDTVDRLQMAGKLLVQGPESQMARFRMHVIGGAMVFGSDWTPVTNIKLEANVEEAVALDSYLNQLLDNMTGAVTPKVIEGERVTAAQVNMLAGREDERSDEVITRFLQQLGRMMTEVQRRLLSPSVATANPAVARLQERLLQFLTTEELELLASMPAVSTVMALTEAERQAIVAACVEGRANPMYDQYAIEREKLAAQVGPDFADRVLVAANDPGVEAEQARMQLLETNVLLNGQEVPVSPRDNHVVHLKSLVPVLQQIGSAMASGAPDAPGLLAVVVAHAQQHLAGLSTVPKAQLPPEIAELAAVIEQAAAGLQQLQAAADAEGVVGAEPPAAGDTQAAGAPPEAAPVAA